ncbi:MAG: hypothetical protein EOP42_22110 [Sphingobacteriaceae bacterium]|nr:MAG: hypothetical protein EOP42_22110 [Sphingobacteriaceae bacterium]
MKNNYHSKILSVISAAFLILALAASCKKDKTTTPAVATPMKLGLYEFGADATLNYRQIQINVSKVGTRTVSYGMVFDTGSGGMVMDAQNIIPAAMITTSGFVFTGDSVVVNGITITNQKSSVTYGSNTNGATVYGNLAYAPVTIGDVNGSIVVNRLPFFLYYRATNTAGTTVPAHDFDVMGVAPIYNVTFSNGVIVTSPFSYYNPGTGLTKGFKMAALGTSNFSSNGYSTFVPGVVTLGLTDADLAASSGFTQHQLTNYPGAGYYPIVSTTVTYNNKTLNTYALFDSGTAPYSYIEDSTAPTTAALLPTNSAIKAATGAGFNYTYTTTATDYLTYLENPRTSGNDFCIFGLNYFLNNEYMIDFKNYKLGLKNN